MLLPTPQIGDDDLRLAIAYELARRSWLWPVAAGLAWSLVTALVPSWQAPSLVFYAAVLLLGLIGLYFAAYALLVVPRVGRRSVRPPALVGLVLNLLLSIGSVGRMARMIFANAA